MHHSVSLAAKIRRSVSSSWFFRVVIGVFVLQAVWIALSGKYPMAFDEDFHFGLIKLYADHGSPFWSAHPAGGDAYGALTRDPSYLFQYLMSFPYRLLRLATDNQTVIILILRAMNIALFAWGLVLWRKLLLKATASRPIVHGVLAIFILIPIVPLLAAQINYDNLIFPVTALCLLSTIAVARQLREGSFPLKQLLGFIALNLFAVITKYAFLPVVLGAVVYMVAVAIKERKRHALNRANMVRAGRALSKPATAALVVAIVLGSLLCIERYGVNLVRYHTLVPDCGQVLDLSHCKSYGPWIRDYNFTANKADGVSANPIIYTGTWLKGMWMRSFFAVDGPASGFETRGPLAVPAIMGAVVAVLGIAAAVYKAPTLLRRKKSSVLILFAVVTAVYVAILWLQEYGMFRDTGQPVAINGRYLLIVAPMVMLIAALGIQAMLRRHIRLQAVIFTVTILGMLWGGGALTYILRSNDNWYWDNGAVRSTNATVRSVVGPVTPGYRQPLLFFSNN